MDPIWHSAQGLELGEGNEPIYFYHHSTLYAVSAAALRGDMVPDQETCNKQAYISSTSDQFVNGGAYSLCR